MNVRLSKYSEFNPEPSKWCHDKRIFEQATKGLEVLVAKNFSRLALPCIAIYPDMDLKSGNYKGFKVAAPEGPLKNYFEQKDTRELFFQLFRDATIDAVAKKEQKKEGKEVTATCSVLKTTGVTKPPQPIWVLTLKELETFFSNLKSEVAKDDGIKLKPKWPKIVDNVTVKLPTNIPSFDEVVENILPSSVYVPFQKFPPGNLHWRLKLVCAYLLKKKNLDVNSFALEIPDDFEPKNFDFNKLQEFSENIEESAEAHHKGKKKSKNDNNLLNNVPFYLEDDGVDYDADSNEESEQLESPAVSSDDVNAFTIDCPVLSTPSTTSRSVCPPIILGPPSPRPNTAPSSRTMPMISRMNKDIQSKPRKDPNQPISITLPAPSDMFYDLNENDDLFNTSHRTGTPERASDCSSEKEVAVEDEDDVFLAQLEDEMESMDEYLELMKETDIRKLLSGEKQNQSVLQVFSFQKVTKAQCFKSQGSDGKVTTTKITFSANINEKVDDLMGKQPLIRLTNYVLYNGSFIFVKDFEVIKIFEKRIADTYYLTQQDYDDLKLVSKPSSNLPQTPTLSMKKLTDKNVDQSTLPTRSSSQRIMNRKHGNSC